MKAIFRWLFDTLIAHGYNHLGTTFVHMAPNAHRYPKPSWQRVAAELSAPSCPPWRRSSGLPHGVWIGARLRVQGLSSTLYVQVNRDFRTLEQVSDFNDF
jgi:hypothetical protein